MAKRNRHYSMIANCEENNDFEEIVAWVNAHFKNKVNLKVFDVFTFFTYGENNWADFAVDFIKEWPRVEIKEENIYSGEHQIKFKHDEELVDAIKGIVGGKCGYYYDKDLQMELTRFENWRYNRFIKKHYPKRCY